MLAPPVENGGASVVVQVVFFFGRLVHTLMYYVYKKN